MAIIDINTLIIERRPVVDDGRDHSARLIDCWNAAARARSGVAYLLPVKASHVCKPVTEGLAMVRIGDRNAYGNRVLTGIYQLYLLGRTAEQIAKMLKMPLQRVEHLLDRNSAKRKSVFIKASHQPLPTEAEIMRRLAAESKV